jgi:hypothetical protein
VPARPRVAAVGLLVQLFGRGKGTAAKQKGDVHVFDREGGPRGGVQSDDHHLADPRDVGEKNGTVMSGSAGAPGRGTTAAER